MGKFDAEKLGEHFSNLTRLTAELWVSYAVTDPQGSTAGTIVFPEGDEMRVLVDKFPRQKEYYSSNLPMSTIEQFSADIARTGLTLLPVKS